MATERVGEKRCERELHLSHDPARRLSERKRGSACSFLVAERDEAIFRRYRADSPATCFIESARDLRCRCLARSEEGVLNGGWSLETGAWGLELRDER